MNRPDGDAETRLRQAVLTLVAWLGVTLLLGHLLRGGEVFSIADIVAALSQGIAWNVLLGLAVLAIATRLCGWSDLGFRAPPLRLTLRLMWFPVLLLLPILGLALAIGLPPPRATAFLAVNTLIVALSEEWMFRGILFRALAARHRPWTAILLTSFIFGAVHVLNGFTFGDLMQSSAQAVAAMMTGLLLVALLIRTGSIWPAVGFHMIWNFGLLLVAYEAAQQTMPENPLPLAAYLAPLALVMPNLLYALYLLRKVGRDAVGPDRG
ncbi:CPBP family intramembrane glutamic endopeptidase [Tabrizicola sp.]|uniref:CPBP family intramembrane glutamic endopeptidase n=1 Tax=Tabrizicola sp. TaxID=2005166 RepID=UPI002FDECE59